MKGIEQARKFYTEVGIKMIADEFGDYQNRIAVGLVGHGSECFGFDDEVSRDHDFEVGFCMWLTKEDEEKIGFKLMRAQRRILPEKRIRQASPKRRRSKRAGSLSHRRFLSSIHGMRRRAANAARLALYELGFLCRGDER